MCWAKVALSLLNRMKEHEIQQSHLVVVVLITAFARKDMLLISDNRIHYYIEMYVRNSLRNRLMFPDAFPINFESLFTSPIF